MNGTIHHVAPEGTTVVVSLAGEIDRLCTSAIANQLSECAPPEVDLVLDLSAVGFMDAGGIAMVVAELDRRHRTGRSVCLRSPSRAVRRLLHICAMDHLIEP